MVEARGQPVHGKGKAIDSLRQAGGGGFRRGSEFFRALGHLRARSLASLCQEGGDGCQSARHFVNPREKIFRADTVDLCRALGDAVEGFPQARAHVLRRLLGRGCNGGGNRGKFAVETGEGRRQPGLTLLNRRDHARDRSRHFLRAASDLAPKTGLGLAEFFRQRIQRRQRAAESVPERVEMPADAVLHQRAEGRARAFADIFLRLADAGAHRGKLVADGA